MMTETSKPSETSGEQIVASLRAMAKTVRMQGFGWSVQAHDLMEQAADRLASLEQHDHRGKAMCSHCDWVAEYKVGSAEQNDVQTQLLVHAATCEANPQVKLIASLRAKLASLEQEQQELRKEVEVLRTIYAPLTADRNAKQRKESL